MKISVRWLNEYLTPGTVTPDEAQRSLTFAGFPIESIEPVSGAAGSGDTCVDVEVTSNRGDVLSHIGVAREIAALTGRQLRLPAAGKAFDWGDGGVFQPPIMSGPGGSNDVGRLVAIDNQLANACPLFTARVIEGVKVGPSPRWLVQALAAVGQRSINNVVDITNFVALEYGQPTHAFDLAKLQASADGKTRLLARLAVKGEKLELLDGKTITLVGDELVVADDGPHGPRAVSLAGVMGGKSTEVTGATTSVLLEAATWAPLGVRKAARRFQIRTDASYRFERTVDPRTIEVAAKRAASLIVKLAGGRLVPGVIHVGQEPRPLAQVRLRPSRCRAMLGVDVTLPRIQEMLERLEIQVQPEPSDRSLQDEPTLICTIPAHRPDVDREIDVIEEIARINGLDKLPMHEKLPVRVAGTQTNEQAMREAGRVLTGLGFFEAITFTFISSKHAKPFTPEGLKTLEVCDGRRASDPVLRPSAIPSLLACRKSNQDRGAPASVGLDVGSGGGWGGGVRLFEISSGFAQRPAEGAKGAIPVRGQEIERVQLTLIADAEVGPLGAKMIEHKQLAVRLMRGIVEHLGHALGAQLSEGKDQLVITPTTSSVPAGWDPSACAEIRLISKDQPSAQSRVLGTLGLIAQSVLSEHGLQSPIVAAEFELAPLIALYPPRARVTSLPGFPSIERDLSLIVAEQTPWSSIDQLLAKSGVALLEGHRFVGVYRGQQAGAGKKSVTVRLRFRDPSRTLRHEEVDPQVKALVETARATLGAEIRAS